MPNYEETMRFDRRRSPRLSFIALLLSVLVIASCSDTKKVVDPVDPALGLSRDDYYKLATKSDQESAVSKTQAPAIPEVADILAAPKPPLVGKEQLVSLSVTEDVPLKDVLMELARLADVDLELDPTIEGGIILRVKDRPFSEVIGRVAELANLRYSMKSGVLKVERDTPYIVSYPIDFLNIDRSSDSGVTINTNVLSAGPSGGSQSLNSGSNASIKSTSVNDLWKSFRDSMEGILGIGTGVAEETPAAAATGGAASASTASAAATPAAGDANTKSEEAPSGNAPYYIINRQGGLVTVYANQKQHKQVVEFINRLKYTSSAQVLIEAKIVEVTLNKEYQSGINWTTLNDADDEIRIRNVFDNVDADANNLFRVRVIDGTILGMDALVKLTERFGTTRTLSSPRLHAMNNQQAVMTFAKNQVYFEIKVDKESNTSSGNLQQTFNLNSTIKTVPIGLILTMQPSINLDANEVTLNVRPTLSRSTESVSDPAVLFLAAENPSLSNIKNDIPVVEVREMDSMLKLKSGEVMVIGGLMEQNASNTDSGLPGAAEIPIVGNLFKSVNRNTTTNELVIFIRATIVGNEHSVPKEDQQLYNKFTADPRPLAF